MRSRCESSPPPGDHSLPRKPFSVSSRVPWAESEYWLHSNFEGNISREFLAYNSTLDSFYKDQKSIHAYQTHLENHSQEILLFYADPAVKPAKRLTLHENYLVNYKI